MVTQIDPAVSSVGRAFALLSVFQSRDRELTAAELARRSGLPRSTAYRMAGELTGLGILEQTLDGRFRLGLKLFELGQLALYQRGLRESAACFLADLSNATRQAAHLAVMDNCEVVYLDIIRPSPPPRLRSRVGGRLPPTVTGVGKAILAFSPPEVVDEVIARGLPRLTTNSITDEARLRAELVKIRRTGLAFDHQEQAVGTSCCAAPIFGANHQVVGAVSVSGHTSSIRLDLVAAAVQSTAAGISRVQGAQT
ncbi:MAG: IclR family transcriptional regulator [Propionibacteriaceae bacterium]|nr:IclR family transcriptional regulator [Propionibacteriaceae bacterium]